VRVCKRPHDSGKLLVKLIFKCSVIDIIHIFNILLE
jgi:hypothetical protein